MTRRIREVAERDCMGRMVAIMEGGYCCCQDNLESGNNQPFLPSSELIAAVNAVASGDSNGRPASPNRNRPTWGDTVDESLKDCIVATCRALSKQPFTPLK